MISYIKRGIAVGLIAIMAAINPMQTLQPTGEGAPTVAKAAETDKSPYIEEVRLAVDKDPDKAKQILTDAGYEVVDQNLNDRTGSIWNKQGEQAVYMGFKRTDDEKKAIRDMKTINMLGRYSSSDLDKWIKENRSTAKEKVQPIMVALKEYRANVKKGDPIALQGQKTMNYFKEDDSGKLMGDLLLSEDSDEELLVKIILEGNAGLVANVFEGLATACDETDSTWLERLENLTYKKLVASYAKEVYGTENTSSEEKRHVEKLIESEYDDSAKILLKKWDKLRDAIVERIDDISFEDINNELLEMLSRGEDAFFRLRQNALVENLAKISYSGKSILELFKMKKSVFEKDITKLYPVVAAMSEGQRAMLEYSDPANMAVQSIERQQTRERLKDGEKIETEEILKTPISIYEGVDRGMFQEGAAMTSRAISNQKSSDSFLSDDPYYRAIMVTSGILALFTGIYSIINGCVYRLDEDYKSYKSISEIKTDSDKIQKLVGNTDDLSKVANYNSGVSPEKSEYLKAVHHSEMVYEVVLLGAAILLAIVFTGMYLYEMYEKHNRNQLPIPSVMVDQDVESDAGKLVTYRAVLWNKDRNDDSGRENRADINGDAGEQWLALYTTTDTTMGDPILADSFYTEIGTNQKIKIDDLVPLMSFGESSAQNLNMYAYNEGGKSNLWMWYKKAKVENSTLIDDREDTEASPESEAGEDDDTAEATEADSGEGVTMTASNIGASNNILFALGGGVVGVIIGLFIGLIIRRKKRVLEVEDDRYDQEKS